jgi:hypothetical protein
MISPSSLSAFSASLAHGGISATGGMSPGRGEARAGQAGAAQPPQPPAQAMPPGAAPGRKMPRGSLLDLSV